jgi:hypothetical protein
MTVFFFQLYGPKGVFYKLSLKCLTIKWAEFTYEVCPYKRVTQFKSYDMGRKTDIGTDSALILGEISNKKVWILKMGNGNREFCSQPRESEVEDIFEFFRKFLKQKFLIIPLLKYRFVSNVELRTSSNLFKSLKNASTFSNYKHRPLVRAFKSKNYDQKYSY